MNGCDPDEDPGTWVPPAGPLWDHPMRDAVGYSHAWLGDDLVLPKRQRDKERKRRKRRQGKGIPLGFHYTRC